MSFSEIFPMTENSVEIGEKVKTTLRTATGSQQVIGTLIGKSGMDLTPVDLFNDILLSEKDIVNFIKQTGADPYSHELPGLIIQVTLVDFFHLKPTNFNHKNISTKTNESRIFSNFPTFRHIFYFAG